MALLTELMKKYKTVSVIGMAKNAGKTTTLNYLIEEAEDAGIVLGVTSTGRDGESKDIVTGTEKPKIYLYPGTFVSIPTGLFEYADAGLEILRITKYHTATGDVMLCRVVDGGFVQVAGPVLTRDQKAVSDEMLALGAGIVLIDGAIDRKAVASPENSDAIILATGAVLSRNMQKVAEETAYLTSLYSLPQIGDALAAAGPGSEDAAAIADFLPLLKKSDRIILIRVDAEKNVHELEIKTGLGASSIIDSAIDEKTRYVYIPGAVTYGVLENIQPKKFRHVTFLIKDATRIFLTAEEWKMLSKKGFTLSTINRINVAAVSVNPVSPRGYSFESKELVGMIRKMIPDVMVTDVRT